MPRALAAYSETISPAKLPLAEAHRGDPSENLHIRSYHTYSRAHVRLFDAIILNCVRRFSGTESRAISAASSSATDRPRRDIIARGEIVSVVYNVRT